MKKDEKAGPLIIIMQSIAFDKRSIFMKKVYYRSEGDTVCADVIPFFEDGEFKLYFLKDYRNGYVFGEGCPWCFLEWSIIELRSKRRCL